MVSPKQLAARGVPVHRLVHEEGSFVVTFPNAFHSGFNTGAPPTGPPMCADNGRCSLDVRQVFQGRAASHRCGRMALRQCVRKMNCVLLAHCRVQLRGGSELWAAGLAAVRHRPCAEVPRRPEAAHPVPRRAAGACGDCLQGVSIQGLVPTMTGHCVKRNRSGVLRWSAMLAHLAAAGL